jgi:hypothetical protein
MVPAWFAWRCTRCLGNKLTNRKRLTQRCAFAGLVFLSVFGFVAYALWKSGAPGSMGLVEPGWLTATAWFPLAAVRWASLTYLVLLVSARKGRYEEPS